MLGSIVIASASFSHALDVVVVVVFVLAIFLCLHINIAFAAPHEHRKSANNRVIEPTIGPLRTIATESVHLKSFINGCIHAHANIS